MSLPQQTSTFPSRPSGGAEISPVDSLAYMADLLENMRKIAQAHGLCVLAHMLELARTETRLLVRERASARATHPPAG